VQQIQTDHTSRYPDRSLMSVVMSPRVARATGSREATVSLPLGYYADANNHGWVDWSGAASQLRCRRPM